jgi:ribose transport system permease protein
VFTILRAQSAQIVLILLVIMLVFTVMRPSEFPLWANFRLILQDLGVLAVLGIGMTFVIITSGIDLSVGSVLVFSGVCAALVMESTGDNGWATSMLGVLVAIASGAAWGTVNGFLVGKARIPALIVTLGTFGAALGFAEVLTGGIDIETVPPQLVNVVGDGNLPGTTIPVLVVIAVVLAAIFAVVLHRTRFGLHTYAIGSNEEAAHRVGIRVDRHLIYVYTLAGALSGLAGILALSEYDTTGIAGQTTTNLTVIAAVVIGGTSLFGGFGTIFGTLVGLMIPAILQNGFVIIGVQPFWQQVAVGVVLIAAVYVDQRRRAAAARGDHGRPNLLVRMLAGRDHPHQQP